MSDDVKALAEVIWTASRADESTISATGANVVASAVLASDWLAARDRQQRRAGAEQAEAGWHHLVAEAAAPAEALLAKVRAFHDAWGDTDAGDGRAVGLWEDLGRLLQEVPRV